jgi:acyl-CoA synthetase (AMP-forming)/AMP-acid ligase II/thioesterase domain-containing protein/acyl carrier protein
MVRGAAERDPDGIAIAAPGYPALAYERLWLYLQEVQDALARSGVGRNDRVAVVAPGGPTPASIFLTVAASAICAPLNPALRAAEFEYYFRELNAAALIVQSGTASPAADVARRQGIAVMTLEPAGESPCGLFTLSGEAGRAAPSPGFGSPADPALVLFTSGTTARPKQVALTHRNICASAHTIATALRLARRDRCLNVMPLYHIHGLIGAVLSTIAAGAGIVCPPGFDEMDFYAWLDEFRPSWYTAVPTIHQAIVSRAPEFGAIIDRSALRFIRSCSAPLPPQVMADLERTFRAPVIEAYGMTEASHQISCNPLPPGSRKPGSVGTATGCDAAVMDEAGALLPPGATGELVIRGPGVMDGYEGGVEVNRTAFINGWFRTGDQGMIDADGYIFIRGRLKEIINRGGMKISPREIEEALLEHPAVARAAVFGVPHPTLGEHAAAAVVLRSGAVAAEAELRQFAAGRLADFRVPSRIIVADHLPTGPTGKLQRTRLAEHFAAALRTPFAPPTDPLDLELTRIWRAILRLDRVGIDDNFFDLGGTSLSAVRMLAEVEAATGRRLPVTALYAAQTIRQLSEALRRDAGVAASRVTTFHPDGARLPFFFLHGDYTGGGFYTRNLAKALGSDQPFHALHPHGLDGGPIPTTIEAMAADYLATVRSLRPHGPYLLGGHCNGGLIALEVAQRLRAAGERVDLLAVVDAPAPNVGMRARLAYAVASGVRALRRWAGAQRRKAYARLRKRLREQTTATIHDHGELRSSDPAAAYRQAVKGYLPRPYAGLIAVFVSESPTRQALPRFWRRIGRDVEIQHTPGNHLASITQHVDALGERLRACLRRTQQAG